MAAWLDPAARALPWPQAQQEGDSSAPGATPGSGPYLDSGRGERGFLVEQLYSATRSANGFPARSESRKWYHPTGNIRQRVDLVKAVEQPPGEAGRLWIDLLMAERSRPSRRCSE